MIEILPVRFRSLCGITCFACSADLFLTAMSTCNLCHRLNSNKPFHVLELYSGIGGSACAIESLNFPLDVRITSVEIHPVANSVHAFNFPSSKRLQRNISSLSVDECDEFDADLWTMSPPCQPFTRQGLQKDVGDSRCGSFVYLMTEILPKIKKIPEYLFVENVKGFEVSKARGIMIDTIKNLGYKFREYLISPLNLGVPNSRLRYYMTASKSAVASSEDIVVGLPNFHDQCSKCLQILFGSNFNVSKKFEIQALSDYLESEVDSKYNLTEKELKHLQVMDIVDKNSRQSCCFTKAYHHMFQGTGSILRFDDNKLRFFTPQEICSLMYFPPHFKFPEEVTDNQKYKLLGNSVNVKVVSFVLKCMLLMK